MKKLMLAVLVGLTVFATASIAAAEVTVGGSMEMRYDLWNNLDLNKTMNENYTETQTQSFFADRILLNVDAKITEGLEAYVELETSNTQIDNRNITSGYGSFGSSDERVQGYNQTDLGAAAVSPVNYQGEHLNVRQAWVNFMVPGLPVGFKIGHQPLALGHGISLNTQRMGTDAILVYSKPIPDLLVAGVFAKVLEQSSSVPGNLTGGEHHDADVWAALANYTFMPGNTVGINYLFVHDGTSAGSAAAIHLHNIGLTADGVIGPINYKAEYDYQDINKNHDGTNHGVNHGHAFMLGAGAKIAMANVGMEVAYGTGTNPNKKGGFGPTGEQSYLSPYGETSYNYAFLYNDKIGQGPLGSGGGFGFGDGTGGFGLNNTGYIKLTGGVNPTDKLSIDGAVLYLRASEPFFNGQSRDLGWEVDAHAGYKIYDNLNLDLTGGVFIPGAWYAYNGQFNGITFGKGVVDQTDDTTSLKRNPAYGLETKLTVKF